MRKMPVTIQDGGKIVSLETRLRSKSVSDLVAAFGLDRLLRVAEYFQSKLEEKRPLFDAHVQLARVYPTSDTYFTEIQLQTGVSVDSVKKAVLLEDQGLWDPHHEELREAKDFGRRETPLENPAKEVKLPYLLDILIGIDDVHKYGVSFRYDELCPEMFGLTTVRNNIFRETYGAFLKVMAQELGVDPALLAQSMARQILTVSLTRRTTRPSEAIAEFIRNLKSLGGFAVVHYRCDISGTYLGDTQPTVVSGDVLKMDWERVPYIFTSRNQVKNRNSSLYAFLVRSGK